MEVLSCSDVQCVGDSNCPLRSPRTKPSNVNHEEEATLLQVDCARQRPGDELLMGIHEGGGTLQNVDCPQQWPGDELSNNSNGGKANSLSADSPHQRGYDLSNGTCEEAGTFLRVEEIGKEEGAKFATIKLLSSSDVLYTEPSSKEKQVRMSDTSIHEVDDTVSNTEDAQDDKASEHKERIGVPPTPETICSGTSDLQHRVVGDFPSNLRESSHHIHNVYDIDLVNLDVQKQNCGLFSPSEDSYPVVLPNSSQEEGNCLQEAECPEEDVTVALWVKWRGKWQAGIRCSRADCPSSILKAKPTHGRKNYFVVFFPHTRSHCWVDKLLVCPINELPEPLSHGTHYRGMEMVKDLSIPRRYIMQKLAVAMLDSSDQLHNEAVIENARKVTAWKEFAMEASRCEGYSDLGRMLLKLHSMILAAYIDPDWLEHSFGSWQQRCQNARSAESVEALTKELVDSVLWIEVDQLWDAPVQPELGPEWRTWKHEVMKWFSTSNPIASGGDVEQQNCDNSVNAGLQISRKRPKLEVRRAEMHASRLESEGNGFHSQANGLETDLKFFSCGGSESDTLVCEPCKEDSPNGVSIPKKYPGIMAGRWDEIVVETGNPDIQTAEVAVTPVEKSLVVIPKEYPEYSQNKSHSGKKYPNRQCIAFIEAKGRQCVRWANDGSLYCCVHLNTYHADKTAQAEQTPARTSMCEGTTTHGTKCKHHAVNGSAFCKKHRLQNNWDFMDTEEPLSSSGIKNSEEKFADKISSSEVACKEVVLVGEGQNPFQENLSNLMEKSEGSGAESPRCIGFCDQNNDQCLDKVKLHSLYCEKHIPGWLKRARNGKPRIITKELYIDMLRNCNSRRQKVQLHQACELLYRFVKNSLSKRHAVPREIHMEWILSEAVKDLSVGECLLKVVSREREKIRSLWGFNADSKQISSSGTSKPVLMLEIAKNGRRIPSIIKCKICKEKFLGDQALGTHWMTIHKNEAQRLFRGYACAICMNSFTNRKVLETHVKERHSEQNLEQCILFQCIPCSNHFVNPDQLWLHVLSLHSTDFRLQTVSHQPNQSVSQAALRLELGNKPSPNSDASHNLSESQDGSRRFSCKICKLKFDLLPDLGRHHQAAHMIPNSIGHFSLRRGNNLNASKLKSGILHHPRFKKGLGAAFRIRNANSFGTKKCFQGTNLLKSAAARLQTQPSETVGLERLVESQCSSVAKILFSEIQRTKPRPSNLEILSIARSTCCKINLHAALEEKYGVLPERLYLKAAKLCSELNIRVEWHLEGFICPRGCKPLTHPYSVTPLMPLSDGSVESPPTAPLMDLMECEEWETDESHFIISLRHFNWKPRRKIMILCEDVSFGRELVPVACVVDDELKGCLHINSVEESNGQNPVKFMPWEGFTYVKERLLDPSLGLDTKSSQLGCACPHLKCYPEACDHVYLFDNDYENAVDIDGKPMHGRFPYDEKGRIILEKGYLVYECNSSCSCDKTCQNRVLQNGVRVKLEVFKTMKKGWAVRAGEAISRGTFVCEYIGEVLNDQEANKRARRHDNEGRSYFYDIDAHIDDMSGLNEEMVPYVIDATKYGNVSRFINHSCSPNLVSYQVLVDSMDCQLAHIGLYVNRDIDIGEELTYDYGKKMLSGDGWLCHCKASNCRGRLY